MLYLLKISEKVITLVLAKTIFMSLMAYFNKFCLSIIVEFRHTFSCGSKGGLHITLYFTERKVKTPETVLFSPAGLTVIFLFDYSR